VLTDPTSWPPALDVLVLAFAVHRVTRLLIADKVTDPIRKRLTFRRTGAYRPVLGYFVTCPWCVSVYVASAAVAVVALGGWSWAAWPALALACSSVTGLLAGREV
jgi:hypothetical protein